MAEYSVEPLKIMLGHSNEEIENLEEDMKIELPYAYKTFLNLFAKGELKIFDHQVFSIEGVKDAIEVAEGLLVQDRFQLPNKAFVFSQWQGYSFLYFELGNDNPEVFSYVEGNGQEHSPKINSCGPFTNWFYNLIVSSLHYRKKSWGINIDERLSELKKIKKADDVCYE
jgi:hypothetical protein